ncbi:hypothetical protein D3C78_1100470 [compost metagenome]
MHRHLVATQQAARGEQEAGVVDGHQLHALRRGIAQQLAIGRRQRLGRAGAAPAEQDQVVVVAIANVRRRDLDTHGGAAAGLNVPRLLPEDGPGAVALAAVVFLVASEAQLVEEAAEGKHGEARQGQQEETQVGADGVGVHGSMRPVITEERPDSTSA